MPEEDTSTRYQGVIRTLLDQNACDKETIRSKSEEVVALKEQRAALQAECSTLRQAKMEMEIEKLALGKKIELLEQSAVQLVQRNETITELRSKISEWEMRYLALVDDMKRQSELWSSEFAKLVQKLETFTRQPTPLELSATVVPTPPSKDALKSTSQTSADLVSPAKAEQIISQGHTGPPVPASKYSPGSAASPGKRRIITAEYEVKQENFEEDMPGMSSGSKRSPSEEDNENAPGRKRQKGTLARRSVKRIEDDDYEGSDTDQEYTSGEDFDEMAIGAEDNHKEIYGLRRVNVREINASARKTYIRPTAVNSGKDRRTGVGPGTPSVRTVSRMPRR